VWPRSLRRLSHVRAFEQSHSSICCRRGMRKQGAAHLGGRPRQGRQDLAQRSQRLRVTRPSVSCVDGAQRGRAQGLQAVAPCHRDTRCLLPARQPSTDTAGGGMIHAEGIRAEAASGRRKDERKGGAGRRSPQPPKPYHARPGRLLGFCYCVSPSCSTAC
jgi:hypothetical protein